MRFKHRDEKKKYCNIKFIPITSVLPISVFARLFVQKLCEHLWSQALYTDINRIVLYSMLLLVLCLEKQNKLQSDRNKVLLHQNYYKECGQSPRYMTCGFLLE